MEAVMNCLRDNIRTELQYLGVEAVNRVRDRGVAESWQDQTGNLRSSVGMAYYEDGRKLISSAFETVGNGAEGSAKGQQFVDQLAQEMSSTYGLCVVAAMDYAEYVEAKGRDVLASTEAWAREEVKTRLQIAIDNTIARMQNVKIT